jgi:hypothetical protein
MGYLPDGNFNSKTPINWLISCRFRVGFLDGVVMRKEV